MYSTHRLSIPLQAIFQNVHLPKLKHFGIHLWYLEEEEILRFLQRHSDTLQSIRFRYISLRVGRWKSLLEYIRRSLKLKWISLRGIGYDPGPPDFGAMGFAPVTISNLQHDSDADTNVSWDLDSTTEEDEDEDEDASPADESHSESDTFEDESDSEYTDHDIAPVGMEVSQEERSDSSATDSSSEEEEELSEEPLDEHESDIEEFHDVTIGDHPSQEPSSTIPSSAMPSSTMPRCECSSGYGFTDLDDNGLIVTPEKWKRWEKWCKKRCVLHDPS